MMLRTSAAMTMLIRRRAQEACGSVATPLGQPALKAAASTCPHSSSVRGLRVPTAARTSAAEGSSSTALQPRQRQLATMRSSATCWPAMRQGGLRFVHEQYQ